MKVTRIITYEGTPEELVKQLGKSLPDGVKTIAGVPTISVLTVGNKPMLELYQELDKGTKE